MGEEEEGRVGDGPGKVEECRCGGGEAGQEGESVVKLGYDIMEMGLRKAL